MKVSKEEKEEMDRIRTLLSEIMANTWCPDPGEGGCTGGPIKGYGCINEAASSAYHGMRDLTSKAELTK